MAGKSDAMAILEGMKVLLESEFSPQQHIIHKPTMKGTGQALKLQLRLTPKWIPTDNGGYFDKDANKRGGLFLELVPQSGNDGKGNATFAWQDADKVIRVKFGMPDIVGLLAAIREYRLRGAPVPVYLREGKGPAKAQSPDNKVFLFHKTEKGSTIITYEFREEDSVLRISKGKDNARSIAINLGEEVLFQRVLEMALDAYLRVGKR